MSTILLGDLFQLKYGKSLRKDKRLPGSIPVFGSNGPVDHHNESLVHEPTIVVGRKGSIGEVHLVQTPFWPIDTTYFIEPLGKYTYDLEWLYRLLKTLRLQDLNRSAAIPGLNRDDVYRIQISLPSLDDQKRIAYVLGKVEGLIAERKHHLQQLDDLLRSVFLEMFGDPVRNEKGWNKEPFTTILSNIDSGKSPKCEAREANDHEWGVLKLGAVTSCVYKQSENKALPEDIEPQTEFEVVNGDLLFSRKNTYELVAACAYVFVTRPRLLIPDLIFRFVFKDDAEINPIFIWKLLTSSSQRRKIQSLASGAAGSMPNISKTKLKQVLLPIPPVELQDRFAATVIKVEEVKDHYQQSLVDLENLYGVLSQKAFKGELDLSRVPLPSEDTDATATEPPDTREAPPTTEPFNLPEPSELTSLNSAEGRHALLNQWLAAWLTHLNDAPFSPRPFIEAAQQRLIELAEEEDLPEWSIAEYNSVQAWVFEALGDQHLTQTYDDAKNRVQLHAVSSR